MIERNSQKEEVFSRASQQVLAGRSIESVVSDYPDFAAELEPMLRLVKQTRGLPVPSLPPDALSRIQQRTLSARKGHQQVAATPGGPDHPPEHLQAPLR